jgi:hypothetical protein
MEMPDQLCHFIYADKLPGVLSVGLGLVVDEVPLPERRHGVVCQSP